jgi:transposase, IS5 family
MRQKQNIQLPLAVPASDHPRAQLLEKISRIVDENPIVIEHVWQDLTLGKTDHGSHGMTAEQVLRCAVLKQLEQYSYDELMFHLHETPLYQSFCRIGIGGKIPSRSSFAEGIKAISSETWDKINIALVRYASDKRVENGREIRGDCTVVEANVHDPTDSVLLYDSVRVITRILRQLGYEDYHDRTRSAKRRMNEIRCSRSKKKRRGRYEKLIRITREVIGYARAAVGEILTGKLECPPDTACRLMRFMGLAEGVIDQAYKRIVLGESVPASEKIVSIFEPHADIIVKDRRDTYYGHKIYLTAGRSNMVLDCDVLEGNPADSTLPARMIRRQENIYGRVPLKAAFDGGFASKDNLAAVKEIGVKDICFSKKRGMNTEDMCRSRYVYKRLWRFRAGVESIISWLKRCFGLGRCLWRSFGSFKSYVKSSVVAANLATLALLTT